MTEKVSKKPNLDYCPYCRVIFSRDILNLIEKGHEPVYCEFCGAEIKNINYLDFNNPNDQIREEFFDPNRFGIINFNLVSNPQAEIVNDNEFPKAFRENLIIVMSRLIYFHLSKIYDIEPLKNSKMELTEPMLNEIADTLVSIINKRIRINFLGNLHKITIKKFENLLKKLQHKVQSNRSYYNDFIVCLRWLIFIIFKLITEMWNNNCLPKFEYTILKDLKNYGFDNYNKQFKNDENKNFLKLEKGQIKLEGANSFTDYYKTSVIIEVRNLSSKYEDSELLFEIANIVLDDLLSEPEKLFKESLPSGFRSNPVYLASSLIYYGLRHETYNSLHKSYRFYGILDYVRKNYPNDTTMKSAITNIVPRIYEYISDSLKMKILYYPIKGHEVKQEIIDKVKELKNLEKNSTYIIKIINHIQNFSKKFPNPKIIQDLAIEVLKDAQNQPNQFSYNETIKYNKWFASPRFISIAFLYLAYSHKDSLITIPLNISDFSENFFKGYKESNQSNINFIYNYLSSKLKEKIRYHPREIYNKEKPFKVDKMWFYLEEFLLIFTEKKSYQNRANEIYLDALSNGFDPNKLISKHPKYLGAALAYFTLLDMKDHKLLKEKYFRLLNKNGYYFESIIYKIMKELEGFINIKSPITMYNSQKFKEELNKLRNNFKRIKRYDNVILINLIYKTLILYRNKFKPFLRDLNFISKKGKASTLLEKLANPNVFNTESNLIHFISNYNRLINSFQIDNIKKSELYSLLNNFERERKIFYRYEERKSEKKEREKERYQKYKEYFYSHKIRVERFLLMLGFSPFDGFDIWRNKVFINGKYRIFANFHHFHYKPEGQSKNDLVFIPVKPPLNYRKGEYLTKKYLTHNVISGLEGNLKRTNISDKTRSRLIKKLKSIEEIIEYNSNVIEKAVYTQKSEFLHSLKNWTESDIIRAVNRLRDHSFSWCKGIEEYLPTAGGYDYERIEAKETESIIQGIVNKRK